MNSTTPLYDRLGGEAAVTAAVDLFYQKVLADDRIAHFFEGIPMARLKGHQRSFLTVAFGGPNRYSGRTLEAAHARLVDRGLTDAHFDAVLEDLGATLAELGVPTDLIAEAAAVAETTRPAVLGRTEAAAA